MTISATVMRKQYKAIWKQNLSTVTIIRRNNPSGGDFFSEFESQEQVETSIQLNIQGTSARDYRNMEAGLIEKAEYSAYALHDVNVQENDQIDFDGNTFKVVNYNESLFNGVIVYRNFHLQQIGEKFGTT